MGVSQRVRGRLDDMPYLELRSSLRPRYVLETNGFPSELCTPFIPCNLQARSPDCREHIWASISDVLSRQKASLPCAQEPTPADPLVGRVSFGDEVDSDFIN